MPEPIDISRKAPLEASMARHPSAQPAAWRTITAVDPLMHLPLGDLLDTLHAVGMEVRFQVRLVDE
jgi:hypothetical protein